MGYLTASPVGCFDVYSSEQALQGTAFAISRCYDSGGWGADISLKCLDGHSAAGDCGLRLAMRNDICWTGAREDTLVRPHGQKSKLVS